MIKKLSILVPAYNEERTIHLILDKIKAVELVNGIENEGLWQTRAETGTEIGKNIFK